MLHHYFIICESLTVMGGWPPVSPNGFPPMITLAAVKILFKRSIPEFSVKHKYKN